MDDPGFESSPGHAVRLWGPLSLLLMDAGVLSRLYSGRGVEFTALLHLVPRLSAAVLLLPLYAFMAYRAIALPLLFFC